MLLLGGREFPKDREELTALLIEALHRQFQLPVGKSVVEVAGDSYPALQKLVLDLTDAHIKEGLAPAEFTRLRQPGITAAQFEIRGRPIRQGPSAIQIEIAVAEARFDFRRDVHGRNYLVLVDGQSGRLYAQGTQADFQSIFLHQVQAAAAEQGVTVESVEWTLTGPSKQSLHFTLRVKASKDFLLIPITTTVRGKGQLAIDDQLNVRLSGLSCEGEGVLSALLVSLVQSRLQQLEGSSIPLTKFSLGRLKVRDLSISCEKDLEIRAVFGN